MSKFIGNADLSSIMHSISFIRYDLAYHKFQQQIIDYCQLCNICHENSILKRIQEFLLCTKFSTFHTYIIRNTYLFG